MGESSHSDLEIVVETFGGNCPVQAEGTVNGRPFYFRARGESWSLGIGDEPVGEPDWEHEQWYGSWPDAGWMSEKEALEFLRFAARQFHDGKPPGKLSDDPQRMAESQKFWREKYGVG